VIPKLPEAISGFCNSSWDVGTYIPDEELSMVVKPQLLERLRQEDLLRPEV
jgi:hypothetical protein